MSSDPDPRYLQGIEHFNRREFFEAHDIWEELWREMRGDHARDYYQGLIQAAVALHHYRNGNRSGAGRMWGFALERLERFRPAHEGLDVDGFIAGMWKAVEGAYEGRPYEDSAVPKVALKK